MQSKVNLDHFLEAYKQSFPTALAEIRSGRKKSHWMWYIFPQLTGLGRSSMAHQYGIANLEMAEAFLAHPVLGKNLSTMARAMLAIEGRDVTQILGTPDDMKLRSSMTLFTSVKGADPVFKKVLEKYFDGVKDARTVAMLESQ